MMLYFWRQLYGCGNSGTAVVVPVLHRACGTYSHALGVCHKIG